MKSVVWNSPFHEKATSVETGIAFERGVPQDVTDEQAEKLLSNPCFSLVQPAPAKFDAKPAVDAA